MNFQSIGQTVKGHSGDLGAKSKGKTEQSRKLRAKPVGRVQLGAKKHLSLYIKHCCVHTVRVALAQFLE